MVENGVGSVVRTRPIGRLGTIVLPGLPAAVPPDGWRPGRRRGLVGIAVEPGRHRRDVAERCSVVVADRKIPE